MRHKLIVLPLILALMAVSCTPQEEELPGASGMPGPAFLASLIGANGGNRLLGEGYTFAGYYDEPQHTVPGYVRQLADHWQAVVLLEPARQTVMCYDKQLAVEPYPYVEMASRLKTYIAEERSLLPDSAVTSFIGDIVDEPYDTTSTTRHFTSRAAFDAAVQAYLANADSVASYPKIITMSTTGLAMSLSIEFARPMSKESDLKQTSITITGNTGQTK